VEVLQSQNVATKQHKLETEHFQVKSRSRKTESKGQAEIGFQRVVGKLDQGQEFTAYGGLCLVSQLGYRVRFHDEVGRHVSVLKIRQGYRESDHLFHMLSGVFAGAGCIEDLGQLQSDANYRRMLGVSRVTDPTTMGDFLRRFGRSDLNGLKDAIWGMRRRVWRKLGGRLGSHASLDLDSRVCPVYGNQKQGADYSYKGSFAYHPEMLSLAETGEWLDVVNQPGNEVSGGRGAYLLRRNLPQVRERFASVCIRGDTKFGRTDVLKVAAGHDARVCLCWASHPTVVKAADDLPDTAWRRLERRAEPTHTASVRRRKRGRNLRRMKARRRGYTDKKLKSEQVAEFAYHPTHNKAKMDSSYRMIVIRKQIEVAGKTGLFNQYEYRFILTDLHEPRLDRIVRYAYGRSNQENLIEQAKNGVSAFRMPTAELLANEVWMTVAMLAQDFKSWICLLGLGRDKLGWEWKRFRFHFVYLVARTRRAARQVQLWLSPTHPHTTTVLNALRTLAPGTG
jgi:hypothetical protein